MKMEDGVVTDFAHEVKACALGQASSSIMAQNVVGAHPVLPGGNLGDWVPNPHHGGRS